jgi:hypothetical protein
MVGKKQKTVRLRVGELLMSEDPQWLKDSTPADLLRWLQLQREFDEWGGTQPPGETTIRWVEPTPDQ